MLKKANIVQTGIPVEWIKDWDKNKARKYVDKCIDCLDSLDKNKGNLDIECSPFFLLTLTVFCLLSGMDVRFVYSETFPEKTKKKCLYIVLSSITRDTELILRDYQVKGNYILKANLI